MFTGSSTIFHGNCLIVLMPLASSIQMRSCKRPSMTSCLCAMSSTSATSSIYNRTAKDGLKHTRERRRCLCANIDWIRASKS